MPRDSKTKRMEEKLLVGILGDRAWEIISPRVPAGGLAIDKSKIDMGKIDMSKIDMTKMEALFKNMPKQEVDAIAARASKSSGPEAKMVLDAINGIR